MMFRGAHGSTLARSSWSGTVASRHAWLRSAARLQAPQGARTLTRANQGDKSWSEILSSAANLARDVAGKVKDSVEQAISPVKDSLMGQASKPSKPAQQQQRQPYAPLDRPGPLGTLMGRAIGGLLERAVNQIGQQLENAAQESRSVYDEAATRIMRSSRLRSAMGEVRVGPIMGQSMSSTYVNGVSSKNINISFQVYGSAGQVALAQVRSQEARKGSESDITVQLPNGSLIKIEGVGRGGGGSSSAAGETIDVEFIEVKK